MWRQVARWLPGIVVILVGLYLLRDVEDSRSAWIALIVIGVLWTIWSIVGVKWHLKRHYTRYVRKHYRGRIGRRSRLLLAEDKLEADEPGVHSEIQYDQIVGVTQMPEHYLVHLSNDLSLIVPVENSNAESVHAFIAELKGRTGVEVADATDWKW